jgi:hypothetical protein
VVGVGLGEHQLDEEVDRRVEVGAKGLDEAPHLGPVQSPDRLASSTERAITSVGGFVHLERL